MERSRPIGLSPGSAAFFAAWVVGLGIARLTGAPAVVLLLAASLVTFLASAIGGWVRVRQISVDRVVAPTVTTVDEDSTVSIVALDRAKGSNAPVAVTISTTIDETPFARIDLDRDGSVTTRLAFPTAGVVSDLVIGIESAGAAGLVWWRRRVRLGVEPIHVAPVSAGDLLPIERTTRDSDGEHTAARGPTLGEVDGIRQWRDGDADHAVHWPSTLRSGELIVRDRSATADTRWTVRVEQAPSRTADEIQATTSHSARLRHTLEEGLRRGHDVVIDDRNTAVDGLHRVVSADDAARWSARSADTPRPHAGRIAFNRRTGGCGHSREPRWASARARWLAAGAAFTSIGMLVGALSSAAETLAIAAAGIGAGVVVSLRYGAEGRTRPMWLRVAIGVAAVAALLLIATEAQGVDGLLRALQGPLPDLLMVLVVIHGFEATDRRTVRVHIAISAVVVAYAAGLRIDERVAWWLAAWGVLCVLATRSTARAIPPSPGARNRRAPDAALRRAGRRRVLRLTASSLVIVAATIALLGLVNVPDGPANLGLPALADDALTVESPGALIGPDGSISRRGDSGDGTRGALGQAGGYPGFSETLDTSIRGDLGDEIVLRVKAPEPAFWRGQTFTEFDGRFWTVSQETGRPSSGPTIDVGPTIGDEGGAPTTEFVQTFYVEADLPNVVFAAPRPSRLMFDGTVHLRPDGALRADATLAEGSVYTVTSRRAEVTANSLRAQGDVGEWFGQFDDPRSSVLLAPYLALPNSTSERTLRLSAQLRADTTFDTVLAYQEWLAINTVYDLHAPIPNEGSDAVDDYLFVTQRGFCEQIASSLVVMLRSQGVPARLATGYLPGERDRVSGVWQVRASDAHAWVEVWFPASGWQPFDPTAEVPLSGTVENSTIGGDLLAAAISSATGHLPELALAGLAMLAGLAALRLTRTVRTRRVRGRWGLLQDRFTELAGDDTGAHPLTNPSIAVQFERPEPRRDGATRAAADATFVATTLDRVRFDPAWIDDEADYALVRGEIERLERSMR